MKPLRQSVQVWDPIVRLTHWGVAALVLWDLYEDSGGPLHRNLGYAAACLVLVRVAWGMVGSGAGNFREWLPRASGVVAYVKAAVAGHPPRFLGHNPLGALMMLVLWILILALAATGWMSRLDMFWGEDWPKDLHGVLAYLLLALVGMHVAAAILMSRLHKENLILSMVTGRKPAAPDQGKASAADDKD
ncbi:cytochrome b/b6 domain-containing protein [Cupriavidus lacunae]|uniref:Cytochrome B oxidoreductase n=1 Tax=Cupriavidus lacunae TaxID=2666307 RepID=A0A370NRX2_9BURK|nr:cytochrome b/b6 domain-containing protein [Cupriavidus lacunae]RDK08350.1 cytochrome B oxidoreductase [Cupriavidus lacunae]